MHKKKRGQAAMEFLMTYGWAILVVLVVIGALAYFDILNPQQFLPQKCQFATGLVCEDHLLSSTGGGTIRVNNGLGNDIQIWNLSFAADTGIINCVNGTIPNSGIVTGGSVVNIPFDSAITGCGSSDMAVYKGSRVKGDLIISYGDLQTGFNHTIEGTLLADVE